MDISIGAFDKSNNSVSATFSVEGKLPWSRPVNAVLTDKGTYDRIATKARIENELAPGVQVKFDLGLIGNAQPVVEVPTGETRPPES